MHASLYNPVRFIISISKPKFIPLLRLIFFEKFDRNKKDKKIKNIKNYYSKYFLLL